ncbi:hypothetical protein D9M70_501870 [compost metagenome]
MTAIDLKSIPDQQLLDELRNRGNVVVMWTPAEIGDRDGSGLEDVVTERGNDYLDTVDSCAN